MAAQGEEGVKAVYTVPYDSFSVVKKKVADINRRAEKYELKPLEIVVLNDNAKYWVDTGFPNYTKLYPVRGVEFYIEGDTIKLPGGWYVIAVMKYEPGMDRPLVTRTSDEALPKRFYTLGPVCEHCKLERKRTTVLVLKNESGEIIQVGKSCLKDFLGHYPESAISYAMQLASIGDWLQSGFDDPKDPSASGIDMLLFLEVAVYFVQKDGFVKSGAVGMDGHPLLSTADTVIDYLANLTRNRVKKIDITPEMTARAKTILAWARETAKTQTGNDYWWNVGSALSIDWVTMRTKGIVASIIAAYNRHLEKKAQAMAAKLSGADEWVGTVGERLKGLKLQLVRKTVHDGNYGTSYILKFVDDAGHSYTWFSSSGVDADGEIWGEGGETYYGAATVKKHDSFRDMKQTVLTRGSFSQKPPEGQKAKGAGKRAKKGSP